MKEKREYDHKCCHCGEPMKSYEPPHPSLKVSHMACSVVASKEIREKVKRLT